MKYFPILLFLLMCISCSGKPQSNTKDQEKRTPVFEKITVPALITNPQDRADYLLEHYWDKYNFSDTTYIHHPEVIEQAFSNYIFYLANATPEKVGPSIRQMLKKAEVEKVVYNYFTGLYEKYLYDPNAPTRNEEQYIHVLEAIIASPVPDEVEKIRPKHLMVVALKNRLGQKATDFEYIMANGKKGALYGVNAEYLILYFYNPDCATCNVWSQHLAASKLLNELMAGKKLKILSIYPDGDEQQWRDHISEMPTQWINGFDKGTVIKDEEVYDLRAIPSLYLLDKEKVVLLKDATYEQIEAFLYHNSRI